MGMLLNKINVLDIFSDHFATLRDARTARTSLYHWLLFFGVPAIPVVVMAYYDVKLTNGAIVLATALSVLAGLLFNLLVLLHTITWQSLGEPLDTKVRELQLEIHANVAYAIVVSLITLIPLSMAAFCEKGEWLLAPLCCAAIFLSTHFALTMGMILKRMDTMLRHRLR